MSILKKVFFIIAVLLVFPFVNNHAFAQETNELVLYSKAAILTDSTSGDILFEKNSDKKIYPASLTKIATAIYAIEKANLSDTVVVSEHVNQVEGTRVYLTPGEKVTLQHLIQGLLINSGNDAGIAIAEYLHGSCENFSKHLNHYLKNEIGVKHTHFTNPHGLFDKDHYTTASDLAKITNYALNNDIFREIFGTKELEWHGEGWDTTLHTHHLLLKGDYPYEGISGGKTGFVNESGHTLATTAANKDIKLTVITINTVTKRAGYEDTMKLLDYGFDNYQTKQLPRNEEFKVGNNIFRAPQTFYYTIPKDEKISTKVSDDGVLTIYDSTSKLINSFKLINISMVNSEAKIPETSTIENKQSTFSIYMLLTFTSLICAWLYKRYFAQS